MRLFLFTSFSILLFTQLTFAKFSCEGDKAQSALRSYFACQNAWTKGVCGIVGGYATTKIITVSVRKALMEILEAGIDTDARFLWDEKVLLRGVEKDLGLALGSKYQQDMATLRALNEERDAVYLYAELNDPAGYQNMTPDDLRIVKEKNPFLALELERHLLEVSNIDERITQVELEMIEKIGLSENPVKAEAEYMKILDKLEVERQVIIKKNSIVLKKTLDVVKKERGPAYLALNKKMKALADEIMAARRDHALIKVGNRAHSVAAVYEQLPTESKEILKAEVRAAHLAGLESGNLSKVNSSVERILAGSHRLKVGSMARLVRNLPRLSPLLASGLFSRAVLYGSGVLTFADLLLHSAPVGCGSDITNKDYIGFDPETCRRKIELDDKAMAFLSLPEVERKKISDKNSQVKAHYEDVCDEVFNSFKIKSFKCEPNKISIDIDKKGQKVSQEILLNDKNTSELVIYPNASGEIRYLLDDEGIKKVEAPFLSRQFKSLGTGLNEFDSIPYERAVEGVNKAKAYWTMRMTMYVPAIKDCCQKAGKERLDCQKLILDPSNAASTSASGVR